MKRFFALILVLALCAGLLAGCGGSTPAGKGSHVTTEAISREMMETLAEYMPDIAESAKYEFKELTASWGDVPIHFLFIVKERFSGINDGNPSFDPWNLFVMDLDDGNMTHVKNRNYSGAYSAEKAEAFSKAIWSYEAYCTGLESFLIDENEVWTDIVTEEDFAALQQRSNCDLPEARNVLTVEKAEMVTASHTNKAPDLHVLYVQVRNHAAPMEEYQQEWYAIDLDRGNVYDNYPVEHAHYNAIHENAELYLGDVRDRYSRRVYDGFVLIDEQEVWDTMLDEHIAQLNEQILTAPVPQPLTPVPQIVNAYEIEGFSEYQNKLASLLNWFSYEGVSAVSAMEYKGTIPEINGGEYHLLFLTTDAPKGYHREDDLVLDLNTGYCYSSNDVDEGYPPMRYCEGIGMLLEGYSSFRDGQQSYIWSMNEERTELLTPEECEKLNEAARFTPIAEEEMPMEETEETISPEEDVTEEWIPEETMKEIPEESPAESDIILPELSLTEDHIQQMVDMVNTYRQQDTWKDAVVIGGMLYQVHLDDLGHTYQLLLIATDRYSEYPISGILAIDLNTGKYWDESTAVWPQGDRYSGYEETKSVLIGAYAEYLLGNTPQLWTEMEHRQTLNSSQIDAINTVLIK